MPVPALQELMLRAKWRAKMRERAKMMKSLNLTTRGTVPIYKIHPELHRLAGKGHDKRRYDRAWKRKHRTRAVQRLGGRLNGLSGTARNTALAKLHRLAKSAIGLTSRGKVPNIQNRHLNNLSFMKIANYSNSESIDDLALSPRDQSYLVKAGTVHYPDMRYGVGLTPEEVRSLTKRGLMKVVPEALRTAAPTMCPKHIKHTVAKGNGFVIYDCGCHWNDPSRN